MLSKNQIREIQALQLKKNRDKTRQFIVEGVKTVTEIISNKPGIVKAVYGTEAFISKHIDSLQKLKFFFTTVTEDELKKISVQSSPNQVLAVCEYFEEPAPNDFDGSMTLYLDEIRDPGNFGTILRLASWFGIRYVHCSPSSCDLYNPKVIQSTMGAFMRVNVVYCGLDELLAAFPMPVYGAVLNGKSLYKSDLKKGILVIGNEANGINEDNLKLITEPITIPAAVKNETESLNAAVACSVIVSEFFRQGVLKGE
jgi:RNA methyltransferase, TrmH family